MPKRYNDKSVTVLKILGVENTFNGFCLQEYPIIFIVFQDGRIVYAIQQKNKLDTIYKWKACRLKIRCERQANLISLSINIDDDIVLSVSIISSKDNYTSVDILENDRGKAHFRIDKTEYLKVLSKLGIQK